MEPVILSRVVSKDVTATGTKAMLLSSFNRVRSANNSTDRRWLENGEIIEFTNVRFTEYNAEFEINHSVGCKIWFSQLDNIFVNPLPDSFEDFAVLSQTWKNFHDDPWKFWDYVKGKKFRVTIDTKHFCIINNEHEIVQELVMLDKLLKYYYDNYKAGNYEIIKGMLKQVRCYCFDEV